MNQRKFGVGHVSAKNLFVKGPSDSDAIGYFMLEQLRGIRDDSRILSQDAWFSTICMEPSAVDLSADKSRLKAGGDSLRTVLVVEDDPQVREILRESFLKEDFKVFEEADGQKGIEFLERQPVDVVITDVRMPKVDGVELIQKIPSNDIVKPVVVCISGYADYADSFYYEHGVDAFFPKPFEIETIVSATNRFLGHRQVMKQTLRRVMDLQKRVVVSERLAEVGQLGSAVAHDLKSPLMALKTYSAWIQDLATDPSLSIQERTLKMRTHSEKLSIAAEAIERLVTGLERIGKDNMPSESHEEIREVAEVFRQVYSLTVALLQKAGVQLTISHCDKSAQVLDSGFDLCRVFINLIRNAVNAIEHQPEPWIDVDTKVENDQVMIRITDSGPGISENLRDRIFDPFFTTKNSKEGSGLGLAICKEILQKYKGHIYLDAQKENTSFVVVLPIIKSA